MDDETAPGVRGGNGALDEVLAAKGFSVVNEGAHGFGLPLVQHRGTVAVIDAEAPEGIGSVDVMRPPHTLGEGKVIHAAPAIGQPARGRVGAVERRETFSGPDDAHVSAEPL